MYYLATMCPLNISVHMHFAYIKEYNIKAFICNLLLKAVCICLLKLCIMKQIRLTESCKSRASSFIPSHLKVIGWPEASTPGPNVLLDILFPVHKHSHQNEDVNIGAPFISDSINWFKCPKYQNDPGWSHRVQLIFSSVLLWWSCSALRCLRDLAALKVSYLIDCLWAEVHSMLPRVWIQSAGHTRRRSHVAVVFVSCQVVHECSLWCQSLGYLYLIKGCSSCLYYKENSFPVLIIKDLWEGILKSYIIPFLFKLQIHSFIHLPHIITNSWIL